MIQDVRNGVTYGYQYDAAGRLATLTVNGVVEAEYRYNALGQQTVRRLTAEQRTIHSVHDTFGNRIAEYEFDALAGTSTLLREYVWLDGRIIAVIEDGAIYHVRTDHIGRPVFATDGTGLKVWEASYLPFGGVHVATAFPGTATDPLDLRFPGQWFQAESGLHQNWMRDYDPTTGRYIQADPLGLVDGASVYGYAIQSPMRWADPTGENIIGTDAGYWPRRVALSIAHATERMGSNYVDMRDANWIGSDKYFHCKANCQASKASIPRVGSSTAATISNTRELIDRYIKGDSIEACEADQFANVWGRRGGLNNERSCEAACSVFRPSSLPVQY